MTTCAQAIGEIFKAKEQVLTTKQIIDAVNKKYPNQWKEVIKQRQYLFDIRALQPVSE